MGNMAGLLIARPGAFRLILAMLVFLSHMSRFGTGRLAVVLFFVLSGYWISNLWEREGGPHRYLMFAANRFLRIWPLYIVVVGISYLIFAHALDLPSITIFGVASAKGVRQLGVEWSLDIEAQFYVLAPLLVVTRLGWWVLPISALGWALFALADIWTVLMYLPAFYTGILIYRYRDRSMIVPPLASLAAFTVLTFAFAILPVTRAIIFPTAPHVGEEYLADLLAMVWAVPLLPYIAASLRYRSSRLDRHLGNLAFPFYLIHEVLIQALRAHGMAKPLTAVICVVAAALLYILVDVPIERFRHRLLGRFKRPEPQPPA